MRVDQDAKIFLGSLPVGGVILDRIAAGRFGWLHLISGALELNGEILLAGDGAGMEGEIPLEMKVPLEGPAAELLVFDLA